MKSWFLFFFPLTLSNKSTSSVCFVEVDATFSTLPVWNLSFPLQMIQDDLAELAIQMEEVEKLVQSNTTHRHEMNQLSSDSQALKRSLEVIEGRVFSYLRTCQLPLFKNIFKIFENMRLYDLSDRCFHFRGRRHRIHLTLITLTGFCDYLYCDFPLG